MSKEISILSVGRIMQKLIQAHNEKQLDKEPRFDEEFRGLCITAEAFLNFKSQKEISVKLLERFNEAREQNLFHGSTNNDRQFKKKGLKKDDAFKVEYQKEFESYEKQLNKKVEQFLQNCKLQSRQCFLLVLLFIGYKEIRNKQTLYSRYFPRYEYHKAGFTFRQQPSESKLFDFIPQEKAECLISNLKLKFVNSISSFYGNRNINLIQMLILLHCDGWDFFNNHVSTGEDFDNQFSLQVKQQEKYYKTYKKLFSNRLDEMQCNERNSYCNYYAKATGSANSSDAWEDLNSSSSSSSSSSLQSFSEAIIPKNDSLLKLQSFLRQTNIYYAEELLEKCDEYLDIEYKQRIAKQYVNVKQRIADEKAEQNERDDELDRENQQRQFDKTYDYDYQQNESDDYGEYDGNQNHPLHYFYNRN